MGYGIDNQMSCTMELMYGNAIVQAVYNGRDRKMC